MGKSEKLSSVKFDENRLKISKPRKSTKKRVALGVMYFFVTILVLFSVYFFINKLSPEEKIKIGDTTLAKKDIDAFAQLIEKYKKSHPGVIIPGDTKEVAADRLILNAGLKLEAKKMGVSVTDVDLAEIADLKFANEKERKNYFDRFRTPEMRYQFVGMENQAYQKKLTDKLISKKDLLEVVIVIDTPYFSQLPQNKVQAEYDKARLRLEKEIIPLMDKKASKEEIIKKADTVWYEEESSQDVGRPFYLSQAVMAVDETKGYQKGVSGYNDVDNLDYLRGDIGKVYKTTDRVNKLKNIGDHTGVFASKTGSLMVVRVENKTAGSYDSWEDFLEHYKNEYVRGKLKVVENYIRKASLASLNTVVKAVTSPGLEKARAAIPDDVCGAHDINITVEARVVSTGDLLSGGKITMHRDAASRFIRYDQGHVGEEFTPGDTCGAVGDHSATTDGSNATSGGNWQRSGTDNDNGDRTIHDTCWDTPFNLYPGDQGNVGATNWVSLDRHADGGQTPGWQASDPLEPANDAGTGHNIYKQRGASYEYGNYSPGWPEPRPGSGNHKYYWVMIRYREVPPPPAPIGGITIMRCDLFLGYAWDQNTHDNLLYSVQLLPAGGKPGQTWTGVSNPNFSHNINGKAIFGTGAVTRTFRFTTASLAGGVTQYTEDFQYAKDCESDHNPYSWIDGNCDVANVNVFDQNAQDRGETVQYSIGMYKDGAPDNPSDDNPPDGIQWIHFNERNIGDFPVTLPDIPDDGKWWIIVTASNRTPDGADTERPLNSNDPWPHNYAAYSYSVENCYNARCLVSQVNSNIPSTPAPANGVKAGEEYTITVTYSNDGGDLPASYGGADLSAVVYAATPKRLTPNQGPPDFVHKIVDLDSGMAAGSPRVFTITLPAPNLIDTYNGHISIHYPGVLSVGDGCDFHINTYKPFRFVPRAQIVEPWNPENPRTVTYRTWLENRNPETCEDPKVGNTILAWAESSFKIEDTQYDYHRHGYPPDPFDNYCDTGVTNPPITTGRGKIYGPFTFTHDREIVAGEDYCPLSVAYQDAGWIGPDYDKTYHGGGPGGKIVTSPSTPSPNDPCSKAQNRPYFKAYGAGSIWAGGNFYDETDVAQSCKGGGTLASWSSNDSPEPAYGASTELHPIALREIIGVNSAQSRDRTYNARSPHDLSFANRDLPGPPENDYGSLGGGSYNAFNGGYFHDGTYERCLPTIDPGSGATVHASDQSIGGTNLPLGSNQVVHVKGDAYISNNITYAGSTGGWTINNEGKTNIPSYKLIADGNIYIGPSVTKLEGLYIAKGHIYTCASGFDKMPQHDLYSNCSNQLTVHGSFVAKKVHLMRTYGSMRNEKPDPPAEQVYGLKWSSAGEYDPGNYNCEHLYEATDGYWKDTASFNYLCTPKSDNDFQLKWTYKHPGQTPQENTGLPACTLVSPSWEPHHTHWADNYICTDDAHRVTFSDDGPVGSNCIKMDEPADDHSDASPAGWADKAYLCATGSVTYSAPGINCQSYNNSGIRSTTRPTCAAEVFDFSAEFYLSENFGLDPEDGGAPHYDAVTSLPPVL